MKPIELEVKILEVNVKDIILKLEKKNAVKLMDTLTYIKVFDVSPKINVSLIPNKYQKIVKEVINITSNGKTLREQNFHLRARQQGDHFEFTVKYSTQGNSKVKSEVEINTELSKSEFEEIENILSKGGIVLLAKQQKKRLSYQIDNLHFDIDTWPSIPTYLEIEGNTEKEILNAVTEFDLDKNKISLLSGAKLFELYGVNFYSNLVF